MIYLDNAATSRFKPRAVFDAMFARLTNSANPGRGGHNDSIDAGIAVYEARAALKKIFHASERHELIFTSNCTEALNVALIGYLSNFRGQKINVVTTSNEHNSVLRPLYFLKNAIHIDIIVVKPQFDGTIDPHDVARAITPDTKLICVNHISNVTGAPADIEAIGAIARHANVPFLVDAAQSAGHLSIDIEQANISFLACAGHKGLHGVQGTGFLIADREIKINPIKFGGTGTDSNSLVQPTELPEGFEAGTVNTAGIVALAAGAEWTNDNLGQVNLHTRYLTGELLYGLRSFRQAVLYSKHNTGVVSFNFGNFTSTDLGDLLNDRDIAVRCGLHCAPLIHRHLGTFERGTVRVSIGYNNTIADVKALLGALEDVARG